VVRGMMVPVTGRHSSGSLIKVGKGQVAAFLALALVAACSSGGSTSPRGTSSPSQQSSLSLQFDLAASDDAAFGVSGLPVALESIGGRFVVIVQNNICPAVPAAPPVLTSSDGRSWTSADPSGQVFPAGSFVSSATVAYGELLAVGILSTPQGGVPALWRTRDGLVWTTDRLDPTIFAPAPVGGTPSATLDSIEFTGNSYLIFGTTRLLHDPAVPPASPTIIGQAWQSSDAKTWVRAAGSALNTQPGQLVHAVATTPTGLVAFPQSLTASTATPATVWRSSDMGQTWDVDPSTTLPVVGTGLAVPARVLEISGASIVVGTIARGSEREAAAWKSTDGRSWTQLVLSSTDTLSLADLSALRSSLIAVGSTMQGPTALESLDGGDSWSSLSLPTGSITSSHADLLAVDGDRTLIVGSYSVAPKNPDPSCGLPSFHLIAWSGRNP
jgi:hypothetical protein